MRLKCLVVLVAAAGASAGCGQGASRVAAPSYDPEGFADAIIAKLDANADGAIDKQELAAAPGLAAGLKAIDVDNNETLSRDELVARFNTYRDLKVGLTSTDLQLLFNGRPLTEGKVRLQPEFFLEAVLEPAEGEIIPDGTVTPYALSTNAPGLKPGYYRVIVDSPRAKTPAKYASAETTPLGIEVAPYTPDSRATGIIKLDLRN